MYYQVSNSGTIKGIWEDSSPYIAQCIATGNINCDLNTELDNTDTIQQSQAILSFSDTFRQATQQEIEIIDITNSFNSIWSTFSPYYQAIFTPLQQIILTDLKNADFTSLQALSKDDTVPDNFKPFQAQLASLLKDS